MSKRWCPVVQTVVLMHAISISDARASGRLDLNAILAFRMSELPIIVFWKEILKHVEHCESSERTAEKSRWMQVGAVRSFSTQRKVRSESSRRLE
jgi:hypothetical protein